MFRKQKQILLLAIMVLLGSLNAVAQEPLMLSLQDALKLAMQNNTNILNSELDLAMAIGVLFVGRAVGEGERIEGDAGGQDIGDALGGIGEDGGGLGDVIGDVLGEQEGDSHHHGDQCRAAFDLGNVGEES